MDHIMDNIFLGCFNSAENKNLLVKNNIKYIFNVAKECHNSANISKDLNIFVHKYDIVDDEDITNDVLNNIYNNLKNIESLDGNILIHCAHGRSRSVCIVLYYLIIKSNFSLSEALDFVKKIRPCIHPSVNYIKLLSTFDNKFDIDSYYILSVKNMIYNDLSDNQIKGIIYKHEYNINSIMNDIIQ